MTNITQASEALIQLWSKNTAIIRKIDANLGAVHGIGLTEYLVLHHLNSSPQMPLRRIDLADSMGRSASGVTKMLNPMEKIGLVTKELNPRDARVSLVKLTTSGLKVYQQASHSLNQIADGIFNRLEASDILQINDLLDGLHV